ncbi:MAG TPA: histidine kinase dimerization/phospho-acceptor domain-containing protein [Candidatus Acidoferrum sp.]|nr:histidine kinase dimerization/phospho-acceptor domain-containing protein [Candidatus Acidoferrum sp.]
MSLPARQKIYLALGTIIFIVHIVVAATAKSSFGLTMYGDFNSVALVFLAILATAENFRRPVGILPLFWKLFAAGMALLLLSQLYWFYFDWRRLNSTPTPVPGDAPFILANVFFLAAFALRPHSESAGRNLRIRLLDLVLLSLWWLFLYAYFSLPWQMLHQDFSHYTPSYYLLALAQHSVIILALAILGIRNHGAWRRFYLQLLVVFILIAAGNMLLSVAIETGKYYAASFYDTPFLLAVYLLIPIAANGFSLQPRPDSRPNRELIQSVWTARFAMLGMVSLPVIALLGLFAKTTPADIALFRLRLVFGAMALLGALVYWKFNLLALELRHLVKLTRDSIANLNAVQQQVTHSEKLIALGRLAAGAAHEISNPLTAIFGYSELLTDIPTLTPEDRASGERIRRQVHLAQSAVISLRNTLRQSASAVPDVEKKPAS